jgi:diacylglycerol kinase (ATP)
MATMQPKRLVVAINPSARFGASRGVGPAVVEQLRALGHEVTSLSEPDFASLKAAASIALDSRPDALVVVGGDGMVSLGVNLVARTGVPLGIIPSGTGNDMARGLCIPVGDPTAATAMLIEALEREPRVIDAGLVTRGGDSGGGDATWFACVLSAGFDALCNERANRMRWPKGKSRYTIALLLELFTLKPIRYRLTLDDEVVELDGILAAVGNNTSFGGGMYITPTASLDDGLLDVITLDKVGRIALLRLFPQIFTGAHVTDNRVTLKQAKRIRIEADAVVAYADGERIGPLPIDIEVVPGALLVLARATGTSLMDT